MSGLIVRRQSHLPQSGAVAVSFILLIVILLGFVGFALDAGRLYVSKAELQNAADSCALAAAGALTGSSTSQLLTAEDYGIAAGTRNLVGMQGSAVAISSADITFSETLNGTYKTRAAIAAGDILKMEYVRCLLSEQNIPTLLIHIVNMLSGQSIGPSTVKAAAIGSLAPSISNCALPLAVCQKDIAGKPKGTWLQGKFENNQNIQGAFKWVQFTGKESNKQFEDMLTGTGMCNLNAYDTVSSGPGNRESLNTAWNTRFGIYRSGAGNPQPSGSNAAIPDGTGWIYDPDYSPAQLPAHGQAKDAYDEFVVKRSQAKKHQLDPSEYKIDNPYAWADDSYFQAANNRRLVTGPIVDCDLLASNGTAPIIDWACYLMLKPALKNGVNVWIEYRGLADISSGCVTSGAPGGPSGGGPKVPTLMQ